ncbi:EI24 domain-containing protein [Victivallis sp. Marseille-Q1083]|uniref:EI24 domain-containing protein n=1 Tax=Victivallis sp. Marseille-Q1083 TaxID=2717288 RepID=UPI0015894CC1|nr:EI24 domain-containing protein [Victivallis sp. Marseille-Q1083]
MYSAVERFRRGAGLVPRGIRLFYGNRHYWPYALWPMALLLLLYTLGLAGLIGWGLPEVLALLPEGRETGTFLQLLFNVLRWLVGGTLLLTVILLMLLLVSTVYEMFGSLFFDQLAAKFEELHCRNRVEVPGWRQGMRFMLQSVCFSAGTLVWGIGLGILGLLVPVVGPLLAVTVVGYRFGLTYLFSSSFNHGIGVPALRRRMKSCRWEVLGLGVTAYLLLLIPFAAIFLLPGFTLAGTLLFCNTVSAPENDHFISPGVRPDR